MAKKGGVLRTVYGVFFALLTLFVGGLLIKQVWSIYRSAPKSPYTVENISKHFDEISLFIWVWLGAVAVNILLAILLPEQKKPLKATVNDKTALDKVKARVPAEGEYFEKAYALSKRQTTFRIVVGVITAVFMLAAASLCVLTLLDIYYRPAIDKPFFTDHNGVVDKITQTAILSLIALTVGAIAASLRAQSRKREKNGHLAIIVDSRRVRTQETVSVEDVPAPPRAEEIPASVEAEVAVEVPVGEITNEPQTAKVSPWAGVIRSIIGKECLGEAITKEQIDEQIQAVMRGLAGSECPANETTIAEETPVLEEVAQPALLPVAKPKKEKKRKPFVKAKKERKEHPKAKKVGVAILRVALAAAGIALVVVGVFNGGMRDVLMKAINICTQCIGLG